LVSALPCQQQVGSKKDASFVFSTSRDLSVKQWRQDTGECVQTLADAHTLNIPGIALSPDETLLCTGSRDYSVKVWDIQTGQAKCTFSAPRNIVTTMSWGSDTSVGGQSIVFQV
jgi:WD40 repeat protein